jgi:hypothetical protein
MSLKFTKHSKCILPHAPTIESGAFGATLERCKDVKEQGQPTVKEPIGKRKLLKGHQMPEKLKSFV